MVQIFAFSLLLLCFSYLLHSPLFFISLSYFNVLLSLLISFCLPLLDIHCFILIYYLAELSPWPLLSYFLFYCFSHLHWSWENRRCCESKFAKVPILQLDFQHRDCNQLFQGTLATQTQQTGHRRDNRGQSRSSSRPCSNSAFIFSNLTFSLRRFCHAI